MQACKHLCAIAHDATQCLESFDRSQSQLLLTEANISLLRNVNCKLNAAARKLMPANFQQSKHDSQLAQLITCLGCLITALVTKLELLEMSSTASSSTCSSHADSATTDMFQVLWCLLITSCNAFRDLPRPWPVQGLAEYQSVCKSTHCMMKFLLRITRARSPLWLSIWEQQGANAKHEDAMAMLYVPLAYVLSIGKFPAARFFQEIEAFPVHYIALHCCLLLEQLERLAPDNAAGTSAPGKMYPIRLDVMSLPLIIIFLGEAISNILDHILRGNRQDALAVLISPAVIELRKRIIIIRVKQRNTNVVRMLDEYSAVENIMFLLDKWIDCNNITAKAARFNAFARAGQESSSQHLQRYVPSKPVSDVQLLRVLFDPLPEAAACAGQRYKLVGALLRSWHQNSGLVMPIPAPSLHQQVIFVYLTAHHCCIRSLVCMRQQSGRPQKRPPQQRSSGPAPSVSSSRFRCPVTGTCTGLHEMILNVCARPRLPLWESLPGRFHHYKITVTNTIETLDFCSMLSRPADRQSCAETVKDLHTCMHLHGTLQHQHGNNKSCKPSPMSILCKTSSLS